MRSLELFYLTNCPYCINAEKAIAELSKENPLFGKVSIRRIEEEQEPEMIKGHDYYYVPSIFMDGKKLYEAQPGQDYDTIKVNVRRCLEAASAGDQSNFAKE